MYMNNVNKKEEIKNIAIKNLRNLGVKYRPKKQRNAQDCRIGRRVFKTVLHLLPMQTVTLKTGQQLIVPKLVSDLCLFILSKVETEGLFRKGGSKARQNEIKLLLDTGCELGSVHHEIDIANVLKTFFRELPEPLFPYAFHELFLHCALSDHQLETLLLSCLLLPTEHLNTLAYFMEFLQEVTKNSQLNKMDSYNLAVVIGPTLFPIEEKFILNSANRLSKFCELSKLLIENASNIGIISKRIIDQIVTVQIPDTLCDEVATKRKKKRSSSLTRMFNGLRKIVSSKSIETTVKSPDILQTPNIRKSERKRKLDAQGFTNKKKYAILQNLPQCTALSTPISINPNPKKEFSPTSTKENNVTTDRKSQPNCSKRNKKGSDNDVPGTLKRHWSAVSQAATSGLRRNKIRNSIGGSVHNKTEDVESDYVKISRSEYEDIHKRVSAIERRISLELDNMEPVANVEKVQCAYEKTLVEAEHLSPTTDQLARRLSRELKIRQSAEQKVVRSPSARKIGTLRRRSRELERQNNKVKRNHSLQLSNDNRTTLKRGKPNTLWTGLTHPINMKCDMEMSDMHSSEPHLVIVRSSTIDKEVISSQSAELSVSDSSNSNTSTENYCYEMHTPHNSNVIQYRSSIVKLRNQNAGMVLAKARLFDQLIDSDSSHNSSSNTLTRSGPKIGTTRNVSQRLRNLKLDKKQYISPKKRTCKNISFSSDSDEKENQMHNVNCLDILSNNNNDKGQALQDYTNRLISPNCISHKDMPLIKKTLNLKSSKQMCHTPTACDNRQMPLKPLLSQRFY